MNIKAFSARVGVSVHTIRYYEKIGLLRHIARNASGHRSFAEKDVDWLGFIVRLKDTGMPLAKIKEYASLREAGSSTALERQRLLEQHKDNIKKHIEVQLRHLAALEDKINLYKNKQVS